MLDTNLTAFSKKPKTIGGFIEYRFYIFNKTGTEQLSIRANVRKQFFEEYKNQIDGVVRSISIKRKVLENTEDGVKTEENENTKDKGSIEIYKQTEKDNK